MKTEKVVNIRLDPVKPGDFQLTSHRYRTFDCVVPSNLTEKDLENPELWVNVAPQLNKGTSFDEVRVIAEDHSFVAHLIVLFSYSSDARLKVMNYYDLGDKKESERPKGKFDYKLAGTKKYIVYNIKTGEELKAHIPTKIEAVKWIDDHERALRS